MKGAAECAEPEKVDSKRYTEIGTKPFNVRLHAVVGGMRPGHNSLQFFVVHDAGYTVAVVLADDAKPCLPIEGKHGDVVVGRTRLDR